MTMAPCVLCLTLDGLCPFCESSKQQQNTCDQAEAAGDGILPGAGARGDQVRILIRLVREGLKKYGGGGSIMFHNFFQ